MKRALGAAAAVVALVIVVGIVAGRDGDGGGGDDEDPSAEIVGLGVAADAADCTPVAHKRPIPAGPPHRTGTLTWPEIPPDSGEHHAQTLRMVPRFYERDDRPPPERAVHNLEHGVVVAWYDTELPEAEVEALRQVTQAMPIKRFVAVPWLRSPFPDGRHVVLTAWGHTQRCRLVSGQVVYDFTRTYADKDAPEKGAPV